MPVRQRPTRRSADSLIPPINLVRMQSDRQRNTAVFVTLYAPRTLVNRVDRAKLREMQRIREQQINTGMDEWQFECLPCGAVLGQEGSGLLICCVQCSTWSHWPCHAQADQETFVCERCAGGEVRPRRGRL